MRRADRLLQIIQILRRSRGPTAASRIAEELEVSLRTLYRDMASLESTGVPVRGEAGVGYVLEEGYDLPPLMFTAAELEALMLGARMVDGRVDEGMTRAAKDAVAKIATVVPEDLRDHLVDTPFFAPLYRQPNKPMIDVESLRMGLRLERQIWISYVDLNERSSERTVWPILISFFAEASVLIAWCTKRQDFRSFRLDHIQSFQTLPEKIPKPRKTLFAQWRRDGLDRSGMSEEARSKVRKIYGV